MSIKAFSKINLGLKIFKKEKKESKHQIDSIFILYKKLYDKIKISNNHKLEIRYFFDKEPVLIKNCLIEKVLMWLQKQHNVNINFKIRVFKKIPMGAGLGGGSSDAAAVLNYICKKNNLILSQKDYEYIALNLGSDIPFFLTKYKFARVTHYGNRVEKIEKIKVKIQLYLPDINNSTKRIFTLLEQNKSYKSNVDIEQMLNDLRYKGIIPNHTINDLHDYILNDNEYLVEYYKSIPNGIFTGSGSGIIVIE